MRAKFRLSLVGPNDAGETTFATEVLPYEGGNASVS